MNLTLHEPELELIDHHYWSGHYVTWNYMMSDQSRSSQKFVRSFQQRYGADRWLTGPQESAYTMVYQWKQAVEKAKSFASPKVREALVGVTFQAPQGRVQMMPNHHLAQSVPIAQITPTGSMRIVAESKSMVEPHAWSRYEPVMRGYACNWANSSGGCVLNSNDFLLPKGVWGLVERLDNSLKVAVPKNSLG